MLNETVSNSDIIVNQELTWLSSLIEQRLSHLDQSKCILKIIELPELTKESAYGKFIIENDYGVAERVLISLCLATNWKPNLLLPFLKEMNNPELMCDFGGAIKDKSYRFIPTIRTVLFLLAGHDDRTKAKYLLVLHPKHLLFTSGVIFLNNPMREQCHLNFEVALNDQFLGYFLTCQTPRMDDGENFPARLSQTGIRYEDVILSERVRGDLDEIIKYLSIRGKLFAIDDVRNKIKASYVVVFTGEPGTGKTITAKTLGKKLNIPVYVVNLARVVSKYIGETEKNLERVFDRFNDKNCILFFDEADALFGKRTEVKDSKDRYANQEVAFLLQKIEEFNGVVILASNVVDVNNVFDKAFQRRIRRIVRFEFPEYQERLLLWEKGLPDTFQYSADLVPYLAESYQLTGASIANILADALVEAVFQNTSEISLEILKPYMEIEYKKTGRKMQICKDENAQREPQMRFGTSYMRGDFG